MNGDRRIPTELADWIVSILPNHNAGALQQYGLNFLKVAELKRLEKAIHNTPTVFEDPPPRLSSTAKKQQRVDYILRVFYIDPYFQTLNRTLLRKYKAKNTNNAYKSSASSASSTTTTPPRNSAAAYPHTTTTTTTKNTPTHTPTTAFGSHSSQPNSSRKRLAPPDNSWNHAYENDNHYHHHYASAAANTSNRRNDTTARHSPNNYFPDFGGDGNPFSMLANHNNNNHNHHHHYTPYPTSNFFATATTNNNNNNNMPDDNDEDCLDPLRFLTSRSSNPYSGLPSPTFKQQRDRAATHAASSSSSSPSATPRNNNNNNNNHHNSNVSSNKRTKKIKTEPLPPDQPQSPQEQTLMTELLQMGFPDKMEILTAIRRLACSKNDNNNNDNNNNNNNTTTTLPSNTNYPTSDEVMLSIVSQREEIEEAKKMDEARLRSENMQHEQVQRQKQAEQESMQNAISFDDLTKLFPKSWILQSQQHSSRNGASSSSTTTTSSIKRMATHLAKDKSSNKLNLLKQLLQLEKKAQSWYGMSLPLYYFQKLQVRIVSMICTTSLSSKRTYDLQKECEILEGALYKLQEQQGGVPKVFLKAQQEYKNASRDKNETQQNNNLNDNDYNDDDNDDDDDDEIIVIGSSPGVSKLQGNGYRPAPTDIIEIDDD